MKNNLLSLMLVAAAALTFTSCTDDDTFVADNPSGGITFVADYPGIENDSRTEFADSLGHLLPMWSDYDALQLLYKNNNSVDLYMGETELPARKASFLLDESPERIAEIKASEKLVAFYSINKVDLYSNFCKYDSVTGIISGLSTPRTQRVKRNNFDGYADILISKPVLPSETDFSNPILLRFKRLNGFIRLNIVDGSENKVLNGKGVIRARLETNGQENFIGNYQVDAYNGTITHSPGPLLPEPEEYCSSKPNVLNPLGITVEAKPTPRTPAPVQSYNDASKPEKRFMKYVPESFYEIGKENEAIYISTLPVTISKSRNESITVELTLADGSIYERTVAVDRDFVVKDGKITTLNFTMSDADLKQSPGVVPPTPLGTAVLNVETPGSLTRDMIVEAFSTCPRDLQVTGKINAADLQLLNQSLLSHNLNNFNLLDLSQANLEGNVLPPLSLEINEKFSDLMLPENITKIESNAIYGNYYLNNITIPYKVTEICDKAIIPHIDNITFLPNKNIALTDRSFNDLYGSNAIFNEDWKNSEHFTLVKNYDNLMKNKFFDFELGTCKFVKVDENGKLPQLATLDKNVITTTGVGQVYSRLIGDAFSYCDKNNMPLTVKIVGDINAEDFGYIFYYPFNYFGDYDVDLSEANIKKGDTKYYIYSDNDPQSITFVEDNVLPTNALNHSNNLSQLILPNSLVKVANQAISNNSDLIYIEFKANTTDIAYEAFRPSYYIEATIKILAPAGPNINSPVTSSFSDKINIIIDKSWENESGDNKPDLTQGLWKNQKWNTIKYAE